jgi:hypothetical protein
LVDQAREDCGVVAVQVQHVEVELVGVLLQCPIKAVRAANCSMRGPLDRQVILRN